MNIVRLILKEAGGRMKNGAGSINSDDNMFAGSKDNAPSDKLGNMLGNGGDNNPIKEMGEGNDTTVEAPETDVDTSDIAEGTDGAEMSFSDENLKEGGKLKGMLKNLELDPMKAGKSSGGGMGGNSGMGKMANMFQGIMGNAGGAEGAGDIGADMGDMGDMADAADAASDERLKRVFGDNEDAIKAFAKINAIKFTYNDTAHNIPGSENKGVDNDPHFGVKAQDLAANPLTESAVSKDPISDYLQVDTKELTMANTAIISEICKRILIIEKVLGIKVV